MEDYECETCTGPSCEFFKTPSCPYEGIGKKLPPRAPALFDDLYPPSDEEDIDDYLPVEIED